MWTVRFALMLVLAFAATHSARSEDPGPGTLDAAIARMQKSLVRIWVVTESPRNGRVEKIPTIGSGTIISKEGDVITSHLLVAHGRWLKCRTWDGEDVEASLVATDPLTDIGVIRMDLSTRRSSEPLIPAQFGDSETLKIGQAVLAMGRPAVASHMVTKGIVNTTARVLPTYLEEAFTDRGELVGAVVPWIMHDAVVFPGSNGGPLVNLAGEVVGINQMSIGNLAFAVPAHIAQDTAHQLAAAGRVRRSWIGVLAEQHPLGAEFDAGILVGTVLPDSPALEAGMRPGDVITRFDGAAVDARIREDLRLFDRLVFGTPVGKRVDVTVLRDGRELTLPLTTREYSGLRGRELEFEAWGMVACDLTPLAAIERGYPDTNGVLVVSSARDGPAMRARPPIIEECVIREVAGRPVASVQDLRRITRIEIGASGNAKGRLVKFEQGARRMVTLVDLGADPKPPVVAMVPKPGLPIELQPIARDLAQALGLGSGGGALITLVYRGHSAERAGFKAGDILLSLDGQRVNCESSADVDALLSRVRNYRIGHEVPVEIRRDGRTLALNLRLEEDLATTGEREAYSDRFFEFTIETLTELDRIQGRLPADLKAVRVASVEPGGWGELAKLCGGDILRTIDGTPVPDVATARNLLQRAVTERAKRVMLFVQRGVYTGYVWIEPHWPAEETGRGADGERK